MGQTEEKRAREIDKLELENELEDRRLSVAQKKAARKEMERTYGTDWKKILGKGMTSIKPDMEVVHNLYSVGADLKDLNRVRGRRP